jgi:integrase
LEEVLGLKWMDIDSFALVINVRRAVTHPQRNQPQVKETKTEASRRQIDLVPQILPYLQRGRADDFVLGGEKPLSYTQQRRMCERIQRDTGFDEPIIPRRFRTTVLTDIYDATKDITQAQAAAGHTTAAMTLRHYVKGRQERANTATPIAETYFSTDEQTDDAYYLRNRLVSFSKC